MGGERIYRSPLKLSHKPKFKLSADSSFFAAGSCFARNLEMALNSRSKRVLSALPDDNIHGKYLHRYNTHSIINDFHHAKHGFDERLVVHPGSSWMDFSFYGIFQDKESLLGLRHKVIQMHTRAFDADVLIVTLGLVECWFDKLVQRYLNIAPHALCIEAEKDRYELRVLDYNENMTALEEFHTYISQHAKPSQRIVVSVSPVAFNATFSGDDVLIANSYSKSTLRAVASDWADRHENVDYFPSYEIAVLSRTESTWLPDHRHVRHEKVVEIVDGFLDTYLN